MISSGKSTKDAPAAEMPDPRDNSATISALAEATQKGLERAFEAQRMAFDFVAQQSTAASKAVKDGLSGADATPFMTLYDLAGRGFERLMETQKTMLDIALGQSSEIMRVMRDQSEAFTKISSGLTETAQQGVERAAEVQKIMLDYAARQNAIAMDVVTGQVGASKGAPGQAVMDSVKQGVEILIEAQKRVLDVTAKPLRAHAAKASE